MPVLAIDTATETLSIALGVAGELAGETNIAAGRSHLELLLPAIDELLAARQARLSDLETICVGIGPGTFSGLRVGVATARALAQGLTLPLAVSSSLQALACGLAAMPESDSMTLLPVIDAKRNQVFSQVFRAGEAGKVEPQSEIMCLSPEDLLAAVGGRAEGSLFAGGNGVEAYLERFEQSGITLAVPGSGAHRIQARYHLPAAATVSGFSLNRVATTVPLYVRDPDADKTVLLRKKEPWLK